MNKSLHTIPAELLKNTVITAFALAVISSGCSMGSYPASPVTAVGSYPKALSKAKKDERYMIMYSGTNVYNVTSVLLHKADKNMTVQLDRVDSTQLSTTTAVDTIGYAARTNKPAANAKKVTLYMKDSTTYTLDEPHTIPLANIAKIEL